MSDHKASANDSGSGKRSGGSSCKFVNSGGIKTRREAHARDTLHERVSTHPFKARVVVAIALPPFKV